MKRLNLAEANNKYYCGSLLVWKFTRTHFLYSQRSRGENESNIESKSSGREIPSFLSKDAQRLGHQKVFKFTNMAQ